MRARDDPELIYFFNLFKPRGMGYKTFASMNVAIIGATKTTEVLAEKLADAGHEVLIAVKENGRQINEQLLELYDNINVYGIAEAAALADIIIIACISPEVREIAYLLDDVRHKVIVDCTITVSMDAEQEVNTMNAIRAITGSAHVVKCFNAQKYKHLLQPLFNGVPIDFFVAGDSKKAKEAVKILSKDMDVLNCYDFGGNDEIAFLDAMARCWYEYTKTYGVVHPLVLAKK